MSNIDYVLQHQRDFDSSQISNRLRIFLAKRLSLLSMTHNEMACWNLMARSLRNILPLMEAAAEHDCSESLQDLPYRAMANGIEYVLAMEEFVRPIQQHELAS
jgi:hypothetical protein